MLYICLRNEQQKGRNVTRRDLVKKFTAGALATAPSSLASMTLENMRGIESKIYALKETVDSQISDLSINLKASQQRLDSLEKKQKVFAGLVCAALLIG